MRRVGQTRKRDANEGEIINALRSFGATVFQLSGPGVPDLLVGFRGGWMPMEIKSAKGGLTRRQVLNACSGAQQVPVVRTQDEALRIIGVLK